MQARTVKEKIIIALFKGLTENFPSRNFFFPAWEKSVDKILTLFKFIDS